MEMTFDLLLDKMIEIKDEELRQFVMDVYQLGVKDGYLTALERVKWELTRE